MSRVALVSRVHGDDLHRLLVEAGYDVSVVRDTESLAALQDRQPAHVVLLHPSAIGEASMAELVRAVTRSPHGRHTCVLPMLQRGELAERVRSLWYGAANVVNLPLREDELLASVASVLGRHHARNSADTAAVV